MTLPSTFNGQLCKPDLQSVGFAMSHQVAVSLVSARKGCEQTRGKNSGSTDLFWLRNWWE
jgi:hypothetical protein